MGCLGKSAETLDNGPIIENLHSHDVSLGNSKEYFEKIKSIKEEEEDNNEILIKSTKTLMEFSYKKIDIVIKTKKLSNKY